MNKLSKAQTFHLEAVRYANVRGQDAYLEVGPCKPFNANSIISLERRGLIEITKKCHGVAIYYAKITLEGVAALGAYFKPGDK